MHIFFSEETHENDAKFSTVFNEENRHTPLDQDELLKFSSHVAKFTGKATLYCAYYMDLLDTFHNIKTENSLFLERGKGT